MTTALIRLIVEIVVAGLALWALGQFPIDPVLHRLARAVIIVLVAVYALVVLLRLLGIAAPGALDGF